jgi:hypothetical protein
MSHERSPTALADHLDSLLRTQVYNGACPDLIPLHKDTLSEIIGLLRRAVVHPPQVEKAVNGELGDRS